MCLSLPYQIESYGARSSPHGTRTMNLLGDLAGDHKVYVVTHEPWGGWNKMRCVKKFNELHSLSDVVNKVYIVIFDGYSYKHNCEWSDYLVPQMAMGKVKCSVFMLRHSLVICIRVAVGGIV